jgi:hypothetical protein
MITVNTINNNYASKNYVLVLLFTITINCCHAQFNFVNNPSFELYDVCPSSLNGLVNPRFWYQPSNQAGVYSNACSNDTCFKVPYNCVKSYNYQPAHSGEALIYLDYKNSLNERTYLQSQLKDSLKAGLYYYVAFFVNLPSTLRYACNNNGLLFTNTATYVDTNNYSYGVLPASPQIISYGNPIVTDTSGWQKISSIYVAKGGEKFITIGNFKYDSETVFKIVNPSGYYSAGYMIDDVSVIPLDSMPLKADAGKDTTIQLGDSAFIGSVTNGIDTLQWLQNGTTIIDSTRPGFWVHPTTNTCYIIIQTVNGFTSSDTVCVVVNSLPLQFTNYKLRFTYETAQQQLHTLKFKQIINMWTTSNEINVNYFNILKSEDGVNFKAIGSVKATGVGTYYFIDLFNTKHLPFNVFYRIVAVDHDGKKQYSVIRNVKLVINNEVQLFPNPAKNVLYISSKENLKEIQVINQLGQVVQQINTINRTSYKMLLTFYAKGLYLLKAITNTDTISFEKFIKQ